MGIRYAATLENAQAVDMLEVEGKNAVLRSTTTRQDASRISFWRVTTRTQYYFETGTAWLMD